jgi:para-aminobenzoate synthetase component 1
MIYNVQLSYTAEAASYYAAIADLPWAIWLDSAGLGHYDVISAQPFVTLVTHGSVTEITGPTGVLRSSEDPYMLLRQQLGEPLAQVPDLPFSGGALGYWGYDLARQKMSLQVLPQNQIHFPDMAVGLYDWALVLDHQLKTARLVSRQRHQSTASILPNILARLQRAALPSIHPGDSFLQQNVVAETDSFRVYGTIISNFTRAQYESAFNAVQAYLQAGDCYQINLAQRFSAAASGDAFNAYLALRRLCPAPYSAYFNLPQVQILCASPERFLRVQNGSVESKPIKGTRPRHSDPHYDRQIAEDLRKHPKDRAENLMIVDLLRNDLGKNCLPGSITVPTLFEVESFANVHHLVSTVKGKLAHGCDALQVLRDSFPGGSITGAPKQRAMQIIEQLEPAQRGIYCGSIGYIGFDGNMDSNIVIRTLVNADNEIHCWAGGGIVADSNAAAEYQETLDKASGMLALMRLYGGK